MNCDDVIWAVIVSAASVLLSVLLYDTIGIISRYSTLKLLLHHQYF